MSLLVTLMIGAADPSLEAALQRALTRETARVELTAWDAPRCKGTFAPAPFDSSGRVPVRVRGKTCEAWGWAQVRVIVQVAMLSRDVKANESMEGAWTLGEQEPRGEVMAQVPAGATATRWLRKGMPVAVSDVRVGPRPGKLGAGAGDARCALARAARHHQPVRGGGDLRHVAQRQEGLRGMGGRRARGRGWIMSPSPLSPTLSPARGEGGMVLLSLVLLSACGVSHIEPYVPKQRNYEVLAEKNVAQPENNEGALWRADGRNANLFSDYRAFREQDLVVVRIEENADARRSADTNLSRETEFSASLQAFLKTVAATAPQLDLTAGLKAGNGFSGDGRTARTEKLTATVPAVVKKVLPNGNLFIEGHRVVLVNNEEQHFYISGVVRPIDIAQDNSVRSSYVADAEIEFTGRGVLSDNQKPGFFTRLWNFLSPL